MTKPLSKVSLKVQQEERERAAQIVESIYGGAPKDTIAFYCCNKAIETILKEDETNE
jgi:hypothetical protein